MLGQEEQGGGAVPRARLQWLHHLSPVLPSQGQGFSWKKRLFCKQMDGLLLLQVCGQGQAESGSPGPVPLIFLTCQCHLHSERRLSPGKDKDGGTLRSVLPHMAALDTLASRELHRAPHWCRTPPLTQTDGKHRVNTVGIVPAQQVPVSGRGQGKMEATHGPLASFGESLGPNCSWNSGS